MYAHTNTPGDKSDVSGQFDLCFIKGRRLIWSMYMVSWREMVQQDVTFVPSNMGYISGFCWNGNHGLISVHQL